MDETNCGVFSGSEKSRATLVPDGAAGIQAEIGFSHSRWSTVLCLFLLACITVVFFHQVLFHPGKMLNSTDIVLAHSEYRFAQWRSFSDWGRFPLWDPTVFCGKSIVGDSLPALLNPPQWLFWIIPSTALFGYFLWFYATAGAFGMFFFARGKGCDAYGAMLAAVIFALGGKMAGHLFAGHLEVLATVMCLPWIMLATDGVLHRPSIFRAGLLGATLALVSTCGSIQIMYYHFLFISAYALPWLLAGIFQRGWGATLRSAVAFAAGALSFLVFAAPWWLPIVSQTLLLTARARGTDYAFSSSFSPDYADLLHLVWPFYGTPPPVEWEFSKGLNPLAYCFWEKTIYVGLIPLALLLPACFESRKNRPVVIIMVVLMVLAFTLGLGNHGPLFWLATRTVPGLALFRCPGRFFFYAAFMAAPLVGLFVSEGASARKRDVLSVSGVLLAAVIAGAFFLPGIEDVPTARMWLPVVIMALFVPVTALWTGGVVSDRLWKTAVLLLVCGDLFVVWQDHMVTVRPEVVLPGAPVAQYLSEQGHRGESRLLASDRVISQTCAAKYGLEIISGYHPGISGRYFDLYRAIWKWDMSETTLLQEHVPEDIAHPVILDLMNVDYFVVVRPGSGVEGLKAVEIPGSPRGKVYRRDSALPRVCIVPGADVPPQGTAMLDALCAMDPRAGCLVEDRPFQGGDAFRPLPFERESASDLTTRFKSEKGGVVLISQAWHPDWRATDHGQPVEVRRVNYDFVGVCVGPGDHEIRVWYRPGDFYLGCCIAAAAWAALVLAGVWDLRRRRRPAACPADGA